jgi:hypothetical protein
MLFYYFSILITKIILSYLQIKNILKSNFYSDIKLPHNPTPIAIRGRHENLSF